MASDPRVPAVEDWNRLHVASPLINLIPQAWRIVRAYWPLLLALIIGTEAGSGLSWLDLLYLPAFFLAPMARTVVHWATLRYRVHEGRLEIRSGLLYTQQRIIGPERIQNSELVRNPFHRATGLVEVRLETAGGEQTEGLLSALPLPQAQALMDRLDQLRRSAGVTPGPDEDAPAERILLEVGTMELLAHGLTSRRVGVLAIIVAVGLELWQQLGGADPAALQQGLHPAFIAGVVLASFVLGVILAVGNTVLRYHGLQLVEREDRVEVRHGLLTRRQVGLQRRRIQLMRVDEPLLRRLMGYATLHMETAGLSAGPDGMRQAEATIPMVDRQELYGLCRQLVPTLDADPWGGELRPAPNRALLRTLQRALVRGLALQGLALLVGGTWGLLVLPVLPAMLVAGWFDWRWQAWRITDGLVVARRGFWIRRTWILPRHKIQSAVCVQDPILRLYGLSQVLVRMAGNSVWLPPLLESDADACVLGATAPPAHGARERDTMPGKAPMSTPGSQPALDPQDEETEEIPEDRHDP
jgi:putative membrane protein